MKKGFITLPILFAILVALGLVVGAGMSYVKNQEVPRPTAFFDPSSLTPDGVAHVIGGYCSHIPGALTLIIMRGQVSLPQNSLPENAIYSDSTDHGGHLTASCNTAAGDFGTRNNSPALPPGSYTVGLYTYENVYNETGGYQGRSHITLLTSFDKLTITPGGNLGDILQYALVGNDPHPTINAYILGSKSIEAGSSWKAEIMMPPNLESFGVPDVIWGDGTSNLEPQGPLDSIEIKANKINLSHVYEKAGIYTVHISINGSAPEFAAGSVIFNPQISVTRSAYSISTYTDTTSGSVPGMSKYTDTDFGFSFWYPSGWAVTSEVFKYPDEFGGGTISNKITLTGVNYEIDILEFTSPSFTIAIPPGACGTCAPITYYFDTSAHTWMRLYPDGPGGAPDATQGQIDQLSKATPADISINTMGGLHMFWGTDRFGSTIIPLSARNFLHISDSSDGYYNIERPLAKTIVAIDPSVATPVSAAEQIKTIQAEKDAYSYNFDIETNQ